MIGLIGFYKSTLIHFDFSVLWFSFIRALDIDASTQILINGQKGQSFSLKKSIRQGCFLVSYLSFFIANVLEYMLDDKKYRVESLKLLDNFSLASIMFANDISYYL